MKNLVYILIFLSGWVYGQDVHLTEPEIEKYVQSIDKLKKQKKLKKLSYPNMSGCGGALYGYYLNGKLVFIDALYQAELGFSSQIMYLHKGEFVKIVCHDKTAEWEKYHQKYPSEEYDESKMTYVDTFLTVIFSNSIHSKKQPEDASFNLEKNEEHINHLIGCGQMMILELKEVEDMIAQIDSLKFVQEMPYICHDINDKSTMTVGCGDELFWKVVKLESYAIEFLIEKLDDTTITKSIVPNFGYNYTTADIAYTALEEIIHKIPTFELLGVQFDEKGCGYCSYWQHLNKSYSNRKKFKKVIKEWYIKNKPNLVWVENDLFATCDCSGKHPNGGHYEIEK